MWRSIVKWGWLVGLVVGLICYGLWSGYSAGVEASGGEKSGGRSEASRSVAAPEVPRVVGKVDDEAVVDAIIQSRNLEASIAESKLPVDGLLESEYLRQNEIKKKQDDKLVAKLSVELSLTARQLEELEIYLKERRGWTNGYSEQGRFLEDSRSLNSVLMDMLDEDQVRSLAEMNVKEAENLADIELKDRRRTMRESVEMTDAEAERVETILRRAFVDAQAQMRTLGLSGMVRGDSLRHNAMQTMAVSVEDGARTYRVPTGAPGEELVSSVKMDEGYDRRTYLKETLGEVEGVLGAERMEAWLKFTRDLRSDSVEIIPRGE